VARGRVAREAPDLRRGHGRRGRRTDHRRSRADGYREVLDAETKGLIVALSGKSALPRRKEDTRGVSSFVTYKY